MTDKLDIATAGELSDLQTRGQMAFMFDCRQVQPTGNHWRMLRGEVPITMRDLGEVAEELDFDIGIELVSRD